MVISECRNLKFFLYLFKNINNYSITRLLQYKFLKDFVFDGKLLDFGGGDKAKYKDFILCSEYESVNIDQNIEPTYVLNVGEEIPCENDVFDHVVTLNTLEHIYDPIYVLAEMTRVLRPGGSLVISCPFLYPIHGHPDDFFRPTKSWYLKTLSDLNYKEIKIIPLVWGPFSSANVCSGVPGPFKVTRKRFSIAVDYIYYLLLKKRKNKQDILQQLEAVSTGFLVYAIK